MRNFQTLRLSVCSKLFNLSISFIAGCGLAIASAIPGWAQSPETAPPELKAAIAQLDAAASQENLKQVMEFYSPQFKNADGLSYQTLEQALTRLWKRYDNLQYKTELHSWENTENGLMAETTTTIQGNQKQKGRTVQIQSTIRSRQYFQDLKLVRQEILTERTQVSTGSNPPQVEIILPETVKVGQEFEFDAIVNQPLGTDLLAGAAVNEKIEGDRYLKPNPLELELLQAGGLFKRAKAPNQPGARWMSAILIRGDGMTMVTQRLKIEQ